MSDTRPSYQPDDRVYLNGELGTVESDVYDHGHDYTVVIFDGHDRAVLRNPRALQRATHQMETLVKEARAAAPRVLTMSAQGFRDVFVSSERLERRLDPDVWAKEQASVGRDCALVVIYSSHPKGPMAVVAELGDSLMLTAAVGAIEEGLKAIVADSPEVAS